jgi:hypothetical protein
LGFRETQVAIVEDGADAVPEAAQDSARAVGRGIVHHHDFGGDAFLFQDAFETTTDVPLAVVGDDCHAHLGVTERFQGFDSKTRQLPASTTLGYKNDGIWAKKNEKKYFAEV